MPAKDPFSFAVKKKTPFQKHKEIEQDKKRRADAEAAKLYAEFAQSFGEDPEGDKSSKSFISGGTIQPGASSQAAQPSAGQAPPSSAKKSGGRYQPSFVPPSLASALADKGDDAAALRSEAHAYTTAHGLGRDEPAASTSGRPDRSKPRSIDVMLEKLKRDQQEREDRKRERLERGSNFDILPSEDVGSFDDSDPWTTNLYVGNLAPDVDEEVLRREFVRFGPIASVKVMWPRDDDQRRRGRNCGFVAFMTRADANRAKDELNNVMLHDNELKIGWGKGVAIPAAPLYTSTGSGTLDPAPLGASVPPPSALEAPPWGPPSVLPHTEAIDRGPDVVITAPSDARVRYIADALASYVNRDGCAFEQAVVAVQAENPDFSFLYEVGSPDHAYYRWRLFSLASGDSMRSWRVEPFELVEGGPKWVPPLMTSASEQTHQTAAQRGGLQREKDKPLSDTQRDRFEDLLRSLTMERVDIRAGMVFALDNADSATEVVEIMTDALTLSETPIAAKVARLLLVSDLLHNTAARVRNASTYRGLLEGSLPDIFESMQEAYRALGGRMAQEAMRRHVLRVLRVWRLWSVFSDDFLNGLQATFLRPVKDAVEEGSEPEPAAPELESLADEDMETRCRRNGLSRQGGRAAMLTRLAALDHYLHGDSKPDTHAPLLTSSVSERRNSFEALVQGDVPVLQGVFAHNAIQMPQAAAVKEEVVEAKQPVKQERPPEPVSKWTLADYDDHDAPDVKNEEASPSDNIFSDAGSTPVADSGAVDMPTRASERDEAVEEDRRLRLRKVEVKVLVLREKLEDQGLERSAIDAEIDAYRTKAVADVDSALAQAASPKAAHSGRDAAKGSKKQPEKPASKGPGDSSRRSSRSKGADHSPERKPAAEKASKASRGSRADDDRDRAGSHPLPDDAAKSRSRHKGKDEGRRSQRSPSPRHERHRDKPKARDRSRDRRREGDRDDDHGQERERGRSRHRSRSRDRQRSSSHSTHEVRASDSRRHGRDHDSGSHRDRSRDRHKASDKHSHRAKPTGGFRRRRLVCKAQKTEERQSSNAQSNGKAAANSNGSGSSPTGGQEQSGPGGIQPALNVLRKQEQAAFVSSTEAAVVLNDIPADNTPNPASSWLPHSDHPRLVRTRQEGIDIRQRIKGVKDKLCTVPEFVKSQTAYRVQQLMLSNTIVKLLAVFLFATPAVLIGGQLYSLLQPNTSLYEGFLKIYSVLYIIPGVNVLEETNVLAFILVNIIFLVGTFTFAVVLGVVSDDITTEVKAIRSGNYPVLTEGHILLLNWNRQTVPLLRQLALARQEQYHKNRGDIVVMAERPKDTMDAEMKQALRGYKLSWQSREGAPYSAADLTRVSAGSAAMIVLLRPESGDIKSSAMAAYSQHVATREVAAILGIHSQRDTVRCEEHSRQSMIVQAPEDGADVVTAAKRVLMSSQMESLGLQDKRDMSMLIAQSALQPGVASVHCQILQKSPGGVSFFLRKFPELAGCHFRDARRRFSDAVVCGIFRAGSRMPILNPGDDEVLGDRDQLIALSNNSRFHPRSSTILPCFQQAIHKANSGRNSISKLANDKAAAVASHHSSLDGAEGNGSDVEMMPARNVVVAGWCGAIGHLVEGMQTFAPPGSSITIICECPPSDMPQGKVNGIEFNFLPGYPHNTSCLEEAGTRSADAIIIGPADNLSDKEADAQLLSTIMVIQDILLDDLKHGSRKSTRPNSQPTHIVGVIRCAESVRVANYLVRDLAENTMTAELLQPDELVSGLIAQVAIEPDLALVLPLLIDSWEGTQARLREPSELGVTDMHPTSFAEVAERAAMFGEVAIGFVTRAGSLVMAPASGLEHIYRNTDRIVVFAHAKHGASCRLQGLVNR
ncbi:hypothetical protein WJX73_002827 [Symbiochloris irregularis]|uniref:Uncharacterized protein n=1 Tax=Symbiochloris irregularis TaxID=706552 RepID=A0AAW1NWU3_9CHLO